MRLLQKELLPNSAAIVAGIVLKGSKIENRDYRRISGDH